LIKVRRADQELFTAYPLGFFQGRHHAQVVILGQDLTRLRAAPPRLNGGRIDFALFPGHDA